MILVIAMVMVGMLSFSGCAKKEAQPAHSLFSSSSRSAHVTPILAPRPVMNDKEVKRLNKLHEQELDFEVHNKTGKPFYAVCFSYIKKQDFTRWRWDKSLIYRVDPGMRVHIDVDTIPDEYDRKHVYGYLAVFDNAEQAEQSTYELLDDKYSIDLDLLHKLKGKVVTVGVERYGFKGETIDPEIIKRAGSKYDTPELDFLVENRTGKTLYLTAFVYQHKGDADVWRFDKTPTVRLEAGQQTLIDIDTIANRYERIFLRGFLGVFDEDEKELAEQVTYELLPPENKVKLGGLFALKGKKVTLNVEQYGVQGDMIDFTIKPIRHIQFGEKQVPEEQKEHITTDVGRLSVWR